MFLSFVADLQEKSNTLSAWGVRREGGRLYKMSFEVPSNAESRCHGWGWHHGYGMHTFSAQDPQVGNAVWGLSQEPLDGIMWHLSWFIRFSWDLGTYCTSVVLSSDRHVCSG